MKKILIISYNRLGDCILTSGVCKYIRDLSPKSHITFVCGPMPSKLFEFCKNIGVDCKISSHWEKGGIGAVDLAEEVAKIADSNSAEFKTFFS